MDTRISSTLVVKSWNSNDRQINLLNCEEGSILFELREYDSATVQFSTSEVNAYVSIETFHDELPTKIMNGDEVEVTDFQSAGALVPGMYSLMFYNGTRHLRLFYKVNPDTLDWEHLSKLRSALDKIVTNLSKDIFSHRRYGISIDDKAQDLLDFFEYLKTSQDLLITYIGSIVDEPLSKISKVYTLHYDSRKADAKTHRYYAKQGINPLVIDNGKIHLEKRCYLDYNVPENTWLINSIAHLLNRISHFQNMTNSQVDRLRQKKDALHSQIQNDSEIISRYKNKPNISSGFVYSAEMRVKQGKVKIGKIEELCEKLISCLDSARIINATLSEYIIHSNLNEVERFNRPLNTLKRIYKDRRYNWFYDFLSKLDPTFNNNENSLDRGYKNKPTWLLFEQYIVVSLIKLLRVDGFRWKSGWLADEQELGINNLDEGTCMIFEKEDYFIKMYYDKELVPSRDNKESTFLPRESGPRRPDVLLALYKNSGELVDTIIVEVKCRKSHNIYNKNAPTKVIDQIIEYKGMHYYCAARNDVISCVSKVLVPYPKQKQEINFDNHYYAKSIKFLPIEVSESISDTESFKALELELGNFLAQANHVR